MKSLNKKEFLLAVKNILRNKKKYTIKPNFVVIDKKEIKPKEGK